MKQVPALLHFNPTVGSLTSNQALYMDKKLHKVKFHGCTLAVWATQAAPLHPPGFQHTQEGTQGQVPTAHLHLRVHTGYSHLGNFHVLCTHQFVGVMSHFRVCQFVCFRAKYDFMGCCTLEHQIFLVAKPFICVTY